MLDHGKTVYAFKMDGDMPVIMKGVFMRINEGEPFYGDRIGNIVLEDGTTYNIGIFERIGTKEDVVNGINKRLDGIKEGHCHYIESYRRDIETCKKKMKEYECLLDRAILVKKFAIEKINKL